MGRTMMPGRDRWLVDPASALFRAGVVGLGYGVAVAVATLATVAHLALPSVLPDDGAWGSIHAYIRDWPMMLMGGAAITAPYALPGFLLTVALAAASGRRDRLLFTAAGGLNAFLALALAGFLGNGPGGDGPYFVFSCFGGGLAGGYAYWLVAEAWLPPVRFLFRPPAISAPGPSGS